MKCEKCGAVANSGDQICINCGAKLIVNNSDIVTFQNNVNTSSPSLQKKSLYIINSILLVVSIIILTVLITVLFLR